MAYTTVAKPKDHVEASIYNGSSSAVTINTMAFKPDFVWTKDRTEAHSWGVYDSSRGIKKWLKFDASQSQNNADDITNTIDASLTAFTNTGFTIAPMSSDPIGNKNGNYFCSWGMKANAGSKTTNNAGANGASIASVYQANTTSGFSIIEYTGTGSVGTIKHGLSIAPKMMWIKRLNASEQWQVYIFGDTITASREDKYLEFGSSGDADSADRWNDTKPTSSVFTVGNHASLNASGSTYIAYVWGEVKGYSKMGEYRGHNNANGATVYTGFRPKIFVSKRTDGNEGWILSDTARGYIKGSAGGDNGNPLRKGNRVEQKLLMNTAATENGNAGDMDFMSNGVKFRDTDGVHNYDYNYVYFAFADMPVVGTNGTIALAL
tara:strand:+ start:955 stop:2085 length:1131 start_codon:yes stop_codon:yes gene_type:complete